MSIDHIYTSVFTSVSLRYIGFSLEARDAKPESISIIERFRNPTITDTITYRGS